MSTLHASVGLGGANRVDDVQLVQRLLNQHRDLVPDAREIPANGTIGPETIHAIAAFQQRVVGLRHPDGRVDPRGRTFAALDGGSARAAAPAGARPAAPAAAPALRAPLRFPVQHALGASYKDGHRYFGARRTTADGAYRAHAGCDLLVPAGTPVLAVADGEVLLNAYHFYDVVKALEVKHDNGLVVRYGEISDAAAGIRRGSPVRRGQVVGYIGRMTSGSSMLHFEVYAGTARGSLTCNGNVFRRRSDLVDPTAYLDAAVRE